jgi:hypothetical protein
LNNVPNMRKDRNARRSLFHFFHGGDMRRPPVSEYLPISRFAYDRRQ